MGIGSSRGENRAVTAAEAAISSPLLEASIDGARGVLLSISGGSDLGLFEINHAAQMVAEAAHPEANIIFGAVIDDALGDEVRVTVIAAGFEGGEPAKYREPRSQQQAARQPEAPPRYEANPNLYAGQMRGEPAVVPSTHRDHREPAHREPAHREPAHREPVHRGEPAHREPVHREPVHRGEPAHEPAHREPSYERVGTLGSYADSRPRPESPRENTRPVPQQAPRRSYYDEPADDLDVPDFLK